MIKSLSKVFSYIFLAIVFIGVSMGGGSVFAQDSQPPYPVRIIVFYLDTCAHCHAELKFLDKIAKKYPTLELHRFEVSSGFQNQSLFSRVVERYGLNGGVPVTIIGDDVFAGFDSEGGESGQKIIENIEYCEENICSNWAQEAIGLDPLDSAQIISESGGNDGAENRNNNQTLGIERSSVKIFGKELKLDSQTSLIFLGIFLGLADGINPCMFSVLIFLLTYLLAIGSRTKAVKAGLAFVGTTFVVYFFLMLGLIKVIDVLRIENFARWFIIAGAFFGGLIMVKDYFFYGKWFSLEIPKKFRPTIKVLVEKGTIPSAITLAIFSSIVELPCTSILPLAYVNVLVNRDLEPFWHLIWYNLFFVMPLLLIIVGVAFAWAKVEALEVFRLKFRKHMRLVAGILLILLAVAFWQGWL